MSTPRSIAARRLLRGWKHSTKRQLRRARIAEQPPPSPSETRSARIKEYHSEPVGALLGNHLASDVSTWGDEIFGSVSVWFSWGVMLYSPPNKIGSLCRIAGV